MVVLSVSQVTSYIKGMFLQSDLLQDVWVQGEISNFKRAASGHLYFTLKDADAALSCVIWRTYAASLPRDPRDGDAVLAHGQISVYEPRGVYQLYVDDLRMEGVGRLYIEFEALKARLEAEGLFAAERKRPIPAWPRRIGVVTSADAAALRDILRTLSQRYPLVEVVLASTLVQGAEAPGQIVEAMRWLHRYHDRYEPIDAIIIARGGGSIEELWAFNDERVVRAVAASRIPVISGVGHETDFTLTDFAADVRAPTPTGAAARAVPDRRDLHRTVQLLSQRMAGALERDLSRRRHDLAQLERILRRFSPLMAIADRRQRVDELLARLQRQLKNDLDRRHSQVEHMADRLAALSPLHVLQRGYAIVRRAEADEIVRSVSQVMAGDPLRIRVYDGEFGAEVSADTGSEGQDG